MKSQKSHFDIYGAIAEKKLSSTSQNGRYSLQEDAEKNIPSDVLSKLRLNPGDHVLDIGCGSGLNIDYMANIAEHVTGCDHPNVIKRTADNIRAENVTLLGGSFLDLQFSQKFDRILIYGVVSVLPDEKTVASFIDKALKLLKPSGRMLIGDIPNLEKRARFASSNRGKEFQKNWEQDSKKLDAGKDLEAFSEAEETVDFNDSVVMNLVLNLRRQGFHAYIVDQPQNLPFGNSREDILVVGSEYEETGIMQNEEK